MTRTGTPRLRSYRVLLWLYPRWFRREYGEDLLQAFRDELRDRGPFRGWLRVIADLLVSIPTQHREAVMAHRSSSSDLVGIVFTNHPDLRRILLADDWVGQPLRKDFEYPLEYHGIRCR